MKITNATEDDIADIALSIVDKMVAEGLIPDCIDTNNQTEFQAQDIIRETLLKHTHKLSENNDIEINITWCTEDVLHTANEMDISLSKKEANEILKMVEEHHDAEFGVSWETIRYTISEFDDARNNAKMQGDEELIYWHI